MEDLDGDFDQLIEDGLRQLHDIHDPDDDEPPCTRAGPVFTSNNRHLNGGPRQQNIYRADKTARIWYRLVQDGEHLDLEPLFDPDFFEGIGQRPTWIDEEIASSGSDFFSGYYGANWIDWAFENGIAPRQPFAIEHEYPRVTGGGYYEDYDVSFDWELAVIEKLEPKHALARWEAFYRERDKYRLERNYEQARTRQLRERKISYMYVRWGRHGNCDPYERGICVELFSSYDPYEPYQHRAHVHLARGISKKGDKEEAWADLEANVRERFRYISMTALRKLRETSKTGWRARRQYW